MQKSGEVAFTILRQSAQKAEEIALGYDEVPDSNPVHNHLAILILFVQKSGENNM
jgi:hypothetical protein